MHERAASRTCRPPDHDGAADARRAPHRAARSVAGPRRRDRRRRDPRPRVRPGAARCGRVSHGRSRAGVSPNSRPGRTAAGRRVARALGVHARAAPGGGLQADPAPAPARAPRPVADTLVRSFPDVAQREPEVVAYHWSCADEPASAMHFWYAAGTRALERAAYLEAAEHFRRGLEALDETDAHTGDELERVEFLTHLAASLQAGHGYAAAGVDEAYARARTACERTRNDDRMVAVIRGQWMFQLLRGHYGTALELADEMLALGQRDDHPARLAEGHLYLGLVHMYLAQLRPRPRAPRRRVRPLPATRALRPHLRGAGRHRASARSPTSRSCCGTSATPRSRASAATSASSVPRGSAARSRARRRGACAASCT